jgi:hypothetical protein
VLLGKEDRVAQVDRPEGVTRERSKFRKEADMSLEIKRYDHLDSKISYHSVHEDSAVNGKKSCLLEQSEKKNCRRSLGPSAMHGSGRLLCQLNAE